MTDKPTSIGLSEAASRIEALLDPAPQESPNADDPASNADEGVEAPTDEVEAQPADTAADETPPSDSETLDDDGAADEEANDDEEDASEDEAEQVPTKFTVKVDGKEEEVTLDELLNGYSRTASYTRKSMALAEERKAFENERKSFQSELEAVRLEREQYAQLLPALIEQIKAEFAEPDWEALLASGDTAEYIRQERLWKEKQDRLAAAQEEVARLNALKEQERQQQIATRIAASRETLVKAMPQWKDPQKWSDDRQKLLEYGKQSGFSEEELTQTYDARPIIVLYKAMKYDELMAKRPKPQPTNGPKPAQAGAQPHQRRQVTNITRAKQRLAKTGRVRDAASVFAEIL